MLVVQRIRSLYTSLDETRINMQIQPLQEQVGGTDCGLFAIAVITAIAHGKDPSQLQVKHEERRDHLLKCFKDEHITLFPCIES